MALKESAVCSAGHEQQYVREDRSGRCTVCGNPLVRGVYDDAVAMGTRTSPKSLDLASRPKPGGK